MTTFANQADHRSGLRWLDSDEAGVLRQLDDAFRAWGQDAGADEIIAPALLPVEDLANLDCYRNFPHLAVVVSGLFTEDVAAITTSAADGRVDARHVREPEVGLPTAACWAVYLAHQGKPVARDTLITLVSRCFRAETHYESLRRLLGFHMREIVALGGQEHCADHLTRFAELIPAFAGELGLRMRIDTATDPFFDNSDSRGLLAQLVPVKREFIVDELAIASVNTHRTFFGERCQISTDGHPAFTSCVAFGLERWVEVLRDRHGADWEVIGERITKARRAVGIAAASTPDA